MKNYLITLLLILNLYSFSNAQNSYSVLIFTKTTGFRHESIEAGRKAIAKLCSENNIQADSTEDAGYFNDETLKKYKVLIFLNTTGDLFNEEQKASFMKYIHSGGTWIGIHAATDAEYNWPWYGKLAGAYFKGHPAQQEAIIKIIDKNNPSTEVLPSEWKRFDEWYNFKEVQKDIHVLGYLDESSYKGGDMNDNHPFIWYHNFEGGMAFYTGGGHTEQTFEDPLFLEHILGAIKFVVSQE